ncbi:MAG: uroporphyrinogen-III C-methyltransferase [Candidatus Omnitrophica bacterium]|nr:uroporphyrinogen-III C-methyltransferase [Candidatus Omnitrophota bacterium]
MKTKTGKVYIVGGGPGDPELITLKGIKALEKADCILYDFLSSPKLLDRAKPSCEKICVGKSDKLHLKEQGDINTLLYKKAREHKRVARLKGGDPFIFSRGSEEAAYLLRRGIDVEVIPGVTSAIAGPESFGIPLTKKNKIQSVGIVTGRKSDPGAAIDAPACDTLIYLMAVANIENVIKALRNSGRSDKTPCAFIEKATCDDSRIVRATLGTIAAEARRNKVKPPAVLIVGEVVSS